MFALLFLVPAVTPFFVLGFVRILYDGLCLESTATPFGLVMVVREIIDCEVANPNGGLASCCLLIL